MKKGQISKKIMFLFAVVILSLSFLSAVNVDPNEFVDLPQVTSNTSLDTTGLERTYLYCTWRIDGMGEEAVLMDGEVCPDHQVQFHFTEGDETYYARIDYAKIGWSMGTSSWGVAEIGNAGEIQVNYHINIPEPSQSFFDNIYNTILDFFRDILCGIFPGLGMCS